MIVRDSWTLIKRAVLTFAWIVVVLVVGTLFAEDFRAAANAHKRAEAAAKLQSDLKSYQDRAIKEFAAAVPKAEAAALGLIDQRIKALDAKIVELARSLVPITPLDLLRSSAFEKAKRHLDLELMKAQRAYLQQLRAYVVAGADAERAGQRLEQLRLAHEAAFAALKEKEAERQHVEDSIRIWTPIWSEKRDRWRQLNREAEEFSRANQAAYDEYERARIALEFYKKMPPPDLEALRSSAVLQMVSQWHDEAVATAKGWVGRLAAQVEEVLPTAFAVFVLLISAPLVIRAVLYYFVAPLAARSPAICLIPAASNPVATESGGSSDPASAVSQQIALRHGQELLVHPEYLQSSDDRSSKQTKWLLNWSIPISSLLSGMYFLTRVRCDTPQVFVLSAKKDPLSEIGRVELHEGNAVVVQPRALVAVVQPIDRPMRITRHWRLGHLTAWLTLQLRYLVFHGPGTLVIKGCRGVRIEPSNSGRSVSQAATIGFSANVRYSVRRIETFMPYLFGKQGLFNDNFAGAPGFYVYEEIPRGDLRRGISGLIEGTLDSMLKAFGI